MWGQVRVHEDGLRAEHAYPDVLHVSEEHTDHVQAISGAYGVEVLTVPVPRWAR